MNGLMMPVKKVKVIECEVYSRVVGYYRPVQNWNTGKRYEFKERHLIKSEKYDKESEVIDEKEPGNKNDTDIIEPVGAPNGLSGPDS